MTISFWVLSRPGLSFFCNLLSTNVWKLSLKTAGQQFFIFISNFCESVVGRLAYLTLDRQTRVQIPCWDQIFFAFRNLFSFCSERLFSAIFKMGLIIFVAYQKLEKNVFERIRQKKEKNLPAPGIELGTYRLVIRRSIHSAMRYCYE